MKWEQAIATIRVYSSALREAALEQVLERDWQPTEKAPETIALAFAFACEKCGLAEEEARRAIDGDPTLAQLYETATEEALFGSADPGPYDVISRESPSGTPENKHFGWLGAMEVGAIPED